MLLVTVRHESTPPDDLLRLNACPACNYSLQGLNESGICPECGSAFDRAVVILHGYARHTRSRRQCPPRGRRLLAARATDEPNPQPELLERETVHPRGCGCRPGPA